MKTLQKKFRIFLFLSIFLLNVFPANSFASQGRNLTVFAEENMVTALTKIARLYSQKNNVVVSINFNSSAELISDIDSGEPADVFISAHHNWIETLKQKGLVDVYNIGYIARDDLVLVTYKDNKNIPDKLKKITLEEALKTLNQLKATIVTDQEGSSAGKHGIDLIKSLSLNDLQLFIQLPEDRAPILNSLKENPEHYALALVSQLKDNQNLNIITQGNGGEIFYQAFVIAGDNMDTAREFLKFLKTRPAKSIFRENGFFVE